MPKTYSDEERAYIKKRLKEEATFCMLHYGVKRTTVDDLIDRVKIPKGTFYLFYKTKELLLFEVLQEQHELLERQLLHEVRSLQGKATVDGLTEILYRYYKAADNSGLIRLLTTGEVELLYRKLPQEVIAEHFSHDNQLVRNVIAILALPNASNDNALSTAFRNLFISMVYKREMGEDFFDEALKLTIKGLVMQMLC